MNGRRDSFPLISGDKRASRVAPAGRPMQTASYLIRRLFGSPVSLLSSQAGGDCDLGEDGERQYEQQIAQHGIQRDY